MGLKRASLGRNDIDQMGRLRRQPAANQEFGLRSRALARWPSPLEPGPVKNQRIAVAPNSLAPRVATIDGGYERLHFESIEQSCGIEGEHQLGTAPERSPAPLHALAIWPQKDEAIQQFTLVGGLKAAVERRNEGGRRHRRLRYAGMLSM